MTMTTAAQRDQVVLILDDDVSVTEGLAIALERDDRTLITCNDIESAELAVRRFRPSVIVSDVRLSGEFAYEGLEFITFAKRHAPDARVILMTGDAPERLQFEAAHRGAVCFLQKPFAVEDLESFVDLMSPLDRLHAALPGIVRMPLLDDILRSGAIGSAFQPIVSLTTDQWEPIGYEALARLRSESPMRNPELLFEYAARKGRVRDLEAACVASTLRSASRLAKGGLLFINIHPEIMASGDSLCELLSSDSERAGIPLSRVVLELTEQAALDDDPRIYRLLDQLRQRGIRFAFDDFGIGYSHLRLIDRIKPEFLKIGQRFGTAFEADSTRHKVVAALVAVAKEFQCEVILEGIEDVSTAHAARALGIALGQGFLFGRPSERLFDAG